VLTAWKHLDDLIRIADMGGIEPVEREDVERHGIAPAYAGFRTTIDPNVLDGGDGQFR
jgi:hypothetical protein